jgi:hypothetical protein
MNTQPKTLMINLGAVADPLRLQLRRYGVKGPAITGLQAKANAINRLYLHSILTEGEAKKAKKRLFQEIKALVEKGEPR